MTISAVIRSTFERFRPLWPRLLAVHVLAGAISILVLGPLLTLLLGWLVLTSGDVALTDEDILFFILSPRGAVLFAAVAGLQLSLLVLEQAAVMLVASGSAHASGLKLAVLGRALLDHFVPIFRLAVRLVAHLALLAIPFLLLLAGIYALLLSRYDINFYLANRPPEFLVAVGLAALCGLVLAWLILRVGRAYLFTLPLILLQGERDPGAALSRARDWMGTAGPVVFGLLGSWLVATMLLLFGAGWVADTGAGLAIRLAGDSLQALSWMLGGVLVAWSMAQFLASWLSASFLGLGLLEAAISLRPELKIAAMQPVKTSTPSRNWKINAGAVVAGAVAIAVLTGWVLVQIAERQDVGYSPQVIAHRGASAQAPENSLAAIELAMVQGADWVEIDVQQTRDGRIAVIHDSDLMKVAGVSLRVREASLAEVQGPDIGVLTGPEFAGQRVPSLEQVLELARDRSGVIIELKYYGGEQGFEQAVVDVVEQMGVQDQVKFMSLSLPGVRNLKALRPDWQVGLLSSVGIGDVSQLEVDFFAVNARKATRGFVHQIKDSGRQVFAWTVNDPALMSTMAGRGVDGIITDYPEVTRRVLEQRRSLELHELIMIQFASLLGSRYDLPQ